MSLFPGVEYNPNAANDAWDSWGRDDFMTYIDDAAYLDGVESCFTDYVLADKLADQIEANTKLLDWLYETPDSGYWPSLEKAGHAAYELLKNRNG